MLISVAYPEMVYTRSASTTVFCGSEETHLPDDWSDEDCTSRPMEKARKSLGDNRVELLDAVGERRGRLTCEVLAGGGQG